MSEYKQVILVRKDLKLSKGKMAAQAAHASVSGVLRSRRELVEAWAENGMAKVVLWVADAEELQKLIAVAKTKKIATAVIRDAGRTALRPGTLTAAAIGPDKEEKIDPITGHLKLVS